jgi:hypothetical protein
MGSISDIYNIIQNKPKNSKIIDMAQIAKKLEQKRLKELQELESNSKNLYDLIQSEHFYVEDVVSNTYKTSININPNLGGRNSQNDTGYTSELILNVIPYDKNISTHTLYFDGFSIVKPGDTITAKIPRYTKKEISPNLTLNPNQQQKTYYLDRDYSLEERAIELSIHYDKIKNQRKDRSVDYSNYIKVTK